MILRFIVNFVRYANSMIVIIFKHHLELHTEVFTYETIQMLEFALKYSKTMK